MLARPRPAARALGVGALVSALAACVVVAVAPPARAAESESTVLDVGGLTFVGSRGARNELVLRAQTARFHPDTNIAHLEDVHAVVQRPEDQPGVEITCDRARLDLETNDFRAEGHVRGVTASGRRFQSAWVQYQSDQGILFTDAPVVIEEATGTLRGGGFRYHVREQRFQLLGGASMVQEPAP